MNVTISLEGANVHSISGTFVTYLCMDPSDMQIKYVGVSTLARVFLIEDARCNSLFLQVFTGNINIAVAGTYAIEREAYLAQRDLIMQLKPQCNMKGFHIPPSKQGVICDQTNERWNTIKEAAAAHNLSESALSNHLAGKPGHLSVKGRTYRRTL